MNKGLLILSWLITAIALSALALLLLVFTEAKQIKREMHTNAEQVQDSLRQHAQYLRLIQTLNQRQTTPEQIPPLAEIARVRLVGKGCILTDLTQPESQSSFYGFATASLCNNQQDDYPLRRMLLRSKQLTQEGVAKEIFHNLYLISPSGFYISTNPIHAERQDDVDSLLMSRPYIERFQSGYLSAKALVITGPYVDLIDQSPILTITGKVIVDNALMGYLNLDIKPQSVLPTAEDQLRLVPEQALVFDDLNIELTDGLIRSGVYLSRPFDLNAIVKTGIQRNAQLLSQLMILSLVLLIGLIVLLFVRRQRLLQADNHTDPLTQLGNRKALDLHIQRIRSVGTPLTVLNNGHSLAKTVTVAVLDIDNFKQVNDRHGHPFGDLVLKQIAMILRQNLREQDGSFRMGGEEFVLLIYHQQPDCGVKALERIRASIEQYHFCDANINLRLTASIGYVTSSDSQLRQDPMALLQQADHQLYRAKHNGKNCICCAELQD